MNTTELQATATLIGDMLTAYGPIPKQSTIELYLEMLGSVRADIVRIACREWLATKSQRPTIADIRAICREFDPPPPPPEAAWPKWLEEIWGPAPEGPRKRQAALDGKPEEDNEAEVARRTAELAAIRAKHNMRA
jgi:hypothetical protein